MAAVATTRRPAAGAGVAAAITAVSVGAGAAVVRGGVTATAVAAAGVLGAVLLARPARLSGFFLAALGLLLAGYALLGRGFAYIGAGGVYVGELVLAVALVALVVAGFRGRLKLVEVAILLFALLGLARTLPFVGAYGKDALRDAVIWGYGVFALAVAATLRPATLERGVRFYAALATPFVLLVPAAAYLFNARPDLLPTTPGTDVPLIAFKAGDAGVHLAGIGAFMIVGLFPRRRSALSTTAFWCVWLVGVLFAATISRGAFLAVVAGMGVALTARPARQRRREIAIGCAVAALGLAIVAPSIDVGLKRDVSVSQLKGNIASVFGGGPADAAGTRSFRLQWWSEIVDYTVTGPFFWGGKGFGVNLADVDGFQTTLDHSLRAPHNSHLTILARMGVPGLVVWLVLQLGFAFLMLRAYRQAMRKRSARLASVVVWLLAYWIAMLVNTSFDPYLEGPQGGIWFWTVVGTGIAVARFVERATSRAAEVRT